MKMIVISDLHYQLERIDAITDALKQVDLVILAGDLANRRKIAHIDAILVRIHVHCPHIFAVTGNWDSEKINTYLAEKEMSLHAQHRVFDGIAFAGVGGALPFIGGLEYTEAQLDTYLKKAVRDVDANLPLVLVSHQPPYGTSNSMTFRGEDAGSHVVRTFIEEHQPLLCLTGHIHEGVGIDHIGKTQVINPGMNGYAHVEINDGTVDSVEIIVTNH